MRSIFRRLLLAVLIAAIAILVVIIWRRAPGLTTLAAALIGAIAIVFKDTLTNLIAGIMLLWSGSFRVGDVIRIDRDIAKPTAEPYVVVNSINLLHVALRARDGMQILIPNSHLASNTVWRWHPQEGLLALTLQLQIDAASNFQLAKRLILEACQQCPRVLREPLPRVRLAGFNDHRATIVLRFCISDPQNGIGPVYYDLIEHIAPKMNEEGIRLEETLY